MTTINTVATDAVRFGDHIVTSNYALYQFSKVTLAVLDTLGTIFSRLIPGGEATAAILKNVRKAPNGIKVLANTTNVVQRIDEFVDPVLRKGLLKNPQKLSARVTLTAGQALDTVNALHIFNIIDIGGFAANAVGNLTIIAAVKNSFIVAASVLSIWANAKELEGVKGRHEAVNNRHEAFKNLQNNTNIEEVRTAVKNRFQAKGDKKAKHQGYLDNNVFDDDTKLREYVDYKVTRDQINKENNTKTLKKYWVNIAGDIARLAITIIGSVSAALAVTATGALLAVGVCALVCSSVGLFKALYREFYAKPEERIIFTP